MCDEDGARCGTIHPGWQGGEPRVRRGGRFTKRPYGYGGVVRIVRVVAWAAACGWIARMLV